MFDRFKDVVCDDWVREVVLSALPAAYSNKVVRFAGIDPERNVVRQSFAKRCFHGRDAALRRPGQRSALSLPKLRQLL
jgi:hypothetical protein